jgi:hypothetical protein
VLKNTRAKKKNSNRKRVLELQKKNIPGGYEGEGEEDKDGHE